VDDSKAKTMRIVKAGTAYVEKKENAGTVFSFRRGDQVEVVEMDAKWATIAVDGRGYYLPREMVRGLDDYVIVIDAGHQGKEDIGKEPIGPGSSDEVQKMDVGDVGVETKQPEYEVTTAVANKLKGELETRGYTVYLTRSNSGQDSSSYKDRAEVANKLYADAYISLHTGYSEDAAVRGVGAVCQTSKNAYISDLYAESKALCSSILDAMAKTTENKKQEIRETDKLSGINWCRVPVALVEMGYLSNENDDRLLSSEQYHDKLVQGIANGLDAYFTEDDKK
jgi:N-acetylmuramoyl-L-alanine amidase